MSSKKDDIIETYLNMMKAQFGHAVKSFWFYDGDLCPCCATNPIDEMLYRGKRAVSLNGFMYRAKGVLIGYVLCGDCANAVMKKCRERQAQIDGTTSLHQTIEQNLILAYNRHISSLDA